MEEWEQGDAKVLKCPCQHDVSKLTIIHVSIGLDGFHCHKGRQRQRQASQPGVFVMALVVQITECGH